MQNRTDSQPSDSIELQIDSMAFGGKGVGRSSGKVYFVEGGIEGDVARVEVLQTSERYDEAKVVEIVKPSPHRGKSLCPVSEVCGGCQWQGVPYAKQLEWKKNFISNALRRIGKIGEDIKIEMMPSPQDNGYRNRIFLRARLRADGSLVVGYFRRSSRDFVPINFCTIAVERLNKFISNLTSLSFLDEFKKGNADSEIKFRLEIQDIPEITDASPHVLATIYEPDDSRFSMDEVIKKISALPSVLWCGNSRDLHSAPVVPFETHMNRKFFTAPGVFQQINILHNHTVRQLVYEAVEHFSPRRILDIYCGSGNLSLAVAGENRVIDGVEFSKRSIHVAQKNLAEAKLNNANYYAGDTEKFLWRAAKQGALYDLVIADPPRDGMFKALIPLMKIKPQQIIYISCDPTTLSRDLSTLCRKDYKVSRFIALDFFPNTYHIESFVILERNENK